MNESRKNNPVGYILLLILAALIWGFSFVAQRVGMQYMPPFWFSGIRFLMGAFVIVPFITKDLLERMQGMAYRKTFIKGSLSAGLLLFLGANLQQMGIRYTSAGHAGFITGLYVVFVPLVGIFFGYKINLRILISVLFGMTGMYFLSVSGGFTIAQGDLYVLAGAFAWTGHVLVLAKFAPLVDPVHLAFAQFFICGILSLVTALSLEPIAWSMVSNAGIPLLYGGLLSVAAGFTLQVIGQKKVQPALASLILNLESVVAAFGGWLILNEVITPRMAFGAVLMLIGMMTAQSYAKLNWKSALRKKISVS